MCAYGNLTKRVPSTQLSPTRWKIRNSNHTITTFHLPSTLGISPELTELYAYLHSEFAAEVETGRTYPQESGVPGGEVSFEAFMGFFFTGDVVVGILDADMGGSGDERMSNGDEDGKEVSVSLEEARRGRKWSDCVASFYYVKPNYPGRSSHICNGGFITPRDNRRKGYGSAIARSFLYYAPRLGYEASVFNLVYASNVASVRLWEGLGFTKVGVVPRAGRLKTEDGKGEVYVDAQMYYKRFDPVP